MTSESDGLTSCSEVEDELGKPLWKKPCVSVDSEKSVAIKSLDEVEEVKKLEKMRANSSSIINSWRSPCESEQNSLRHTFGMEVMVERGRFSTR